MKKLQTRVVAGVKDNDIDDGDVTSVASQPEQARITDDPFLYL